MTEQEIYAVFEACNLELSQGIIERWNTLGGPAASGSNEAAFSVLEESAKAAAVSATLVWMQLRLAREFTRGDK